MIKADLEKEELISGSGIKYRFDKRIYLNAVKYCMKKFDIKYDTALNQINYFIVSAYCYKNKKYINRVSPDKKSTNARLKNVVECEYTWNDLWNNNNGAR